MRKAVFLTIETGVEDMVRDGCQSGGQGCAALGPGDPRDLAQKQWSVISNCPSGRILAFPFCGYPQRIQPPDSCAETRAQPHPRETTNAERPCRQNNSQQN